MRSSPDSVHVLVVADDPALLRTMADVVHVKGFSAVTATTGREAIAIARTMLPAVALVDLRLPDTDVLDLLTQLQAGGALTQSSC